MTDEERKAKKSASSSAYYVQNRDKILARNAAWDSAHPGAMSARSAKHYAAHREQVIASASARNKENPEQSRAATRRYHSKNIEKENERCRLWALANPEKIRAKDIRWGLDHPEQRREQQARHCAKRRILGFVPMNPSAQGCEAHHLNQTPGDVIYIPIALHKSVRHNSFTGKNMEQINALAFQWLAQQVTP